MAPPPPKDGTPLSVAPPPLRTAPPLHTVRKQAVRILLECFLVMKSCRSIGNMCLWNINNECPPPHFGVSLIRLSDLPTGKEARGLNCISGIKITTYSTKMS